MDDALAGLLAGLRSRIEEMTALLATFVSSESPSSDPGRLATTAELVEMHGTRLLGAAPERVDGAGAPVLRWRLPASGPTSGTRPVVLLAHLDTVWPAGTTARWPFRVDGDRATGPGAFDMKAGLVQALFALAAVMTSGLSHPPLVLLVTADEEIGSPGGRAVIEATAHDAAAVLVLEAALDGRLKIARKGVSNYDLHLAGRSAHAGLEPERGVNALVAQAHVVLAVQALADADLGTTVTPTLASAGTTRNTVPASATVALDVRAATLAEQQRVDAAIRALHPPGDTTLGVDGGPNRPPMEAAAAKELAVLAERAAQRCGLPAPGTAAVGGGSDGNFTAALGVRTLDGLGAVGAGAHAEGEHVVIAAMPERAALVAALIFELEEEAL